MFTFTPLLGAQSDTRASQSILELDGGVKILVDVGWDERFDTRQLTEIEKHVPTLSFVLLTHATISHLGAYAHCCKQIPLFTQIPVYATSPVIAFGRTLLQDLYSSNPLAATFIPNSSAPDENTSTASTDRSNILREAPSFEEINKYFSLITPLKYSQPHQPTASYFSASLEGLTLTAYNAGHTLGGTIWHIQHGMESIVYATDWHQARENVIAGAAWFGGVGGSEVIEQLRKPTALVCSSVNGNRIALAGGRKARDDLLLSHIASSVAKGGTVLIPTDSSARILELAWLLEKTWQEAANGSPLKNTKVYLVSKAAHATLRHARSLLEWMDDSIVREFEGDDEGVTRTHKRSDSKQVNGTAKASRPFDFKHIKIVEKKTQVDKIFRNEGSRVILASDTSMEWGFSKNLLETISHSADNLVILTERGDAGQNMNVSSIQQRLWQWYQERQDGVALEKSIDGEQIEQVHTGGRSIQSHEVMVQPLDATETQKYQQFMATQRQVQASLVTSDSRQLVQAEEAMDDDDESSSESDESDDEEQQGRALNVSAALGHGSRNKVAISDEDLGVSILLRRKGVHDYDVRNKKGRNAVFPHTHTRKRGDEFGDFIKPEDFLREEEKEERLAIDKQTGALGQKRKWDSALQSAPDTQNKRLQTGKQSDNGVSTAGEDHNNSQDSDLSEDEEQAQTETSSGPSKVVITEREFQVHSRLAFVDFSGLHDQRSLQMLIPLIGPKKLIFTGGSADETSTLAADCKELLGVKIDGAENDVTAEIFTPVNMQNVDASVDTNAWMVKLTRDLAKRLQWQNVKNVGVVTVTGQLRAEAVTTAASVQPAQNKKLKLEVEEEKKMDSRAEEKSSFEAVLEPIPTNLAASTRSTSQPVHVGDLRLADLRRLMNSAGHSAEFRGEGTLLVDSMIAVRKMPNGKIVVEGAPVSSLLRVNVRGPDSFTQVKRKIYEGLAVVAAG